MVSNFKLFLSQTEKLCEKSDEYKKMFTNSMKKWNSQKNNSQIHYA